LNFSSLSIVVAFVMSRIIVSGPLGRPSDPHEHRKQHATDTMGNTDRPQAPQCKLQETAEGHRGWSRSHLHCVSSFALRRLCFQGLSLCGSSPVACQWLSSIQTCGRWPSSVGSCPLHNPSTLASVHVLAQAAYVGVTVPSALHVKAVRPLDPPRFRCRRRRARDQPVVSAELTPSSAPTSSKRSRSCGG
jgi:hypothetical protein